MKSAFLGSTASVLVALSFVSYPTPLIQGQDPSRSQGQSTQQVQRNQQDAVSAGGQSSASSSKQDAKVPAASAADADNSFSVTGSANERTASPADSSAGTAAPAAGITAPLTYMATAYSLPGRTASGMHVARGLIAADPTVLPFGTRVRLDAGSYSGEYIVADAGTAVKGRRIDIWMPTLREAQHFGLRAVKLTVLSYGSRRQKSIPDRTRPRRVISAVK